MNVDLLEYGSQCNESDQTLVKVLLAICRFLLTWFDGWGLIRHLFTTYFSVDRSTARFGVALFVRSNSLPTGNRCRFPEPDGWGSGWHAQTFLAGICPRRVSFDFCHRLLHSFIASNSWLIDFFVGKCSRDPTPSPFGFKWEPSTREGIKNFEIGSNAKMARVGYPRHKLAFWNDYLRTLVRAIEGQVDPFNTNIKPYDSKYRTGESSSTSRR